MKYARLLLYVAKLFWSDFLHWVGNGQSWNIASCFARLHIKIDIADKVSAYSFCEFGVAPPAFCPDPHRDPRAEINGNGWILPGRKFQPFFSFDLLLHDLVHKISHLFCGLLLLLAGSVGVGSQGKTSIVVAQHTAYSFYVYTIL